MRYLCCLVFVLTGLISFGTARAQNKKLGIMNADGSNVRTLIDMPGYFWQGSPHFSHDGKRIAFDATINQLFQNDRIFVIDAAGGEPLDLGLGSQPSWSSDDKQIAFFMIDGNPNNERPGVYVMNADGKSRTFLTPGFSPRWSPDGGKISYLNDHDGVLSIWAYGILESEAKPLLTEKLAAVGSPAVWSPDGKQIAFLARHKTEGELELCVAQTEGPSDIKMLSNDHISGIAPCWSPGNKILFVMTPAGKSSPQPHWLDPANPDKLTPIDCDVNNLRDPGWSPDMKQIVFRCDR